MQYITWHVLCNPRCIQEWRKCLHWNIVQVKMLYGDCGEHCHEKVTWDLIDSNAISFMAEKTNWDNSVEAEPLDYVAYKSGRMDQIQEEFTFALLETACQCSLYAFPQGRRNYDNSCPETLQFYMLLSWDLLASGNVFAVNNVPKMEWKAANRWMLYYQTTSPTYSRVLYQFGNIYSRSFAAFAAFFFLRLMPAESFALTYLLVF